MSKSRRAYPLEYPAADRRARPRRAIAGRALPGIRTDGAMHSELDPPSGPRRPASRRLDDRGADGVAAPEARERDAP